MFSLLLKITFLTKNENDSLDRSLKNFFVEKISFNIQPLVGELPCKYYKKYRKNKLENFIEKKLFGFIKINLRKKTENRISYSFQFLRSKKIDLIL